MSNDAIGDLNVRLARLEGGNSILQWTVGLVSAVLLAGLALLIAVQLQTQSKIDSVSADVGALPAQINANLLQLTSTVAQSITAAKSQAPQVVVVPMSPPAAAPSSSAPQH